MNVINNPKMSNWSQSENKIPFILFVSTEPIGKYGYMTWDQIKEIEKEDFVFIGNHSHSHDYLVNYNFEKFKNDPEEIKDFYQFIDELSIDAFILLNNSFVDNFLIIIG